MHKLALYNRDPSLTEKTLIMVPLRLAVKTRLRWKSEGRLQKAKLCKPAIMRQLQRGYSIIVRLEASYCLRDRI
jgi:hypothetical protein